MTLGELKGKFESMAVNSGKLVTLDLFELAQKFFSKEDVQELMLNLNRDRLFAESTTNKGQYLPLYAEKTAKHKRKVGLPDKRYTYYETGETHESLEVIASDESVMIALGLDAPDYAHELDDSAWGLTDGDYDDNIREGLLNFVQEEIKNHIYG